MLTSVVAGIRNVRRYPELQGARVLVTGVSTDRGFDVARAFAEAGARLVVQLTPSAQGQADERNAALLQVLASTATEIRASEHSLDDAQAVVRFAQGAAQAYGGLDAVVNVVAADEQLSADATENDLEDAVSRTLRDACLVTRVAANRMSLTWSEGLVLNAVVAAAPRTRADAAYLGIVRQALGAMTRAEARTWSANGIRINAVAPRGTLGETVGNGATSCGLTSEADIAALTLHLASKRGQNLSGHVFDAEGVAHRAC